MYSLLANLYREKKLLNEEILNCIPGNCIPGMVSQEQNETLQVILHLEELKHVVFSMSLHSIAGPDGMNDNFFQSC